MHCTKYKGHVSWSLSIQKVLFIEFWDRFFIALDSYCVIKFSFLKGVKEYSALFTEGDTDLLDLLFTFPSCEPPLCRLIGKYLIKASCDLCDKTLSP